MRADCWSEFTGNGVTSSMLGMYVQVRVVLMENRYCLIKGNSGERWMLPWKVQGKRGSNEAWVNQLNAILRILVPTFFLISQLNN